MDRLHVLVNRAPGVTIPVTIPAYELPILHALHGSEQVFVEAKAAVKGGKFDAEEARDALLRKYRGYEDAVRRVYPTPDALAKAVKADKPKSDKADPAKDGDAK